MANLFELESIEPVSKIIKELKEKGEDFEWYPTTDTMIDSIVSFLKEEYSFMSKYIDSIMDIGAGDGRVLLQLKEKLLKNNSDNNINLYAIEKATLHQKTLIDKKIALLGEDIFNTTLYDKNKDLIFCNPPYSQYENFLIKILEESNFEKVLIFIVPVRWRENERIKSILKQRNIKEENIKSIMVTDFENGERKARAKVEIFAIINSYGGYSTKSIKDSKDILFDKFIFPNGKPQTKSFNEQNKEREKKFHSLVNSNDAVKMLIEFYNKELNNLIANYQKIGELDNELFEELEINLNNIKVKFYEKITNLKNIYWQEVLNKVDSIKQSLTSSSIESIWGAISYKNEMDFTEFNIRTIILHFLKEAYKFKDNQLIELFEKDLFFKENIKKYKSNQRMFNFDRSWDGVNNNTHYYLTNKIVLKGYYTKFNFINEKYTLERGLKLLNDIRAVIRTLGYETEKIELEDDEWKPTIITNKEYFIYLKSQQPLKKGEKTNLGKIEEVYYIEKTQKYQYLIDNQYYNQDIVKSNKNIAIRFKGFKNGNLHININKKIMDKLNIQFSRLKGWVRTPQEASEEMDVSLKDAQEAFRTEIVLKADKINNLLGYSK